MMLNVSHDAVKEKNVLSIKKNYEYDDEVRSTESLVFLFIVFYLLQRMK